MRCGTYVPVHQVQVEVLKPELAESVLDCQRDVLGVVVQLEKLRGDKDFLTGDAGVLDALANFGLVTICPGTAEDDQPVSWLPPQPHHRRSLDVPVAVLQSMLDGTSDLALATLVSLFSPNIKASRTTYADCHC